MLGLFIFHVIKISEFPYQFLTDGTRCPYDEDCKCVGNCGNKCSGFEKVFVSNFRKDKLKRILGWKEL